jgi:SAM-dependent methyltransferase
VGDARELPAADGSADAVLLLGPLYHLLDRRDRVGAWREAARVLWPGGVVVAATISRFASLFDGFVKGYHRDPRFRSMVAHTLACGVHRNDADEAGWFTSAYFHHPDEIPAEVSDGGLVLRRVVAVEGPLRMTDGQDRSANWLSSRTDSSLASAPRLSPRYTPASSSSRRATTAAWAAVGLGASPVDLPPSVS